MNVLPTHVWTTLNVMICWTVILVTALQRLVAMIAQSVSDTPFSNCKTALQSNNLWSSCIFMISSVLFKKKIALLVNQGFLNESVFLKTSYKRTNYNWKTNNILTIILQNFQQLNLTICTTEGFPTAIFIQGGPVSTYFLYTFFTYNVYIQRITIL